MSGGPSKNGGMCCGGNLPANSPTGDADDFLLIGLQGSGKTLLGQRLRTVYGRCPGPPFRVVTTETHGCQDFRVPTARGCPVRDVKIRECGGSMQPLWRNWYSRPIRGVVFALDASDAAALAGAAVELYEVLQRPDLSPKPVCLVLTKADLPVTLSRAELDLTLGLAELERLYPGRLRVAELSSVLPPEECPALGALVDWMAGVKARDLGLEGRDAAGRQKR
ncbi:hypothetical protein HYH03_016994 [Edaphochlamys debaryana]|uniref:ADP-ribosylation factor-like protein 16 n=1 Tax=Edaphochlamys debaryana TaxID=47281 RepID=A0A836BPQ4_9CHLO|nr:hypothetical protein HYH03_016994 [Edaphochlamys debaryana]|eukprot:KAG2484182.1 hypothetical protein HYH03_016994 [Edaphochlamys debaryana]